MLHFCPHSSEGNMAAKKKTRLRVKVYVFLFVIVAQVFRFSCISGDCMGGMVACYLPASAYSTGRLCFFQTFLLTVILACHFTSLLSPNHKWFKLIHVLFVLIESKVYCFSLKINTQNNCGTWCGSLVSCHSTKTNSARLYLWMEVATTWNRTDEKLCSGTQ